VVELASRPVVLGSQEPRIRVVPPGVEHPRWSEVIDFVAALGIELDPWQLEALRVALMRDPKMDVWAAFTVALCVPRQNGKNGILEARQLVGARLLGEPMQIHSAHLADTSKEGFRRLDHLLDANAWLSKDVKHIWRTNGHEAIEFVGGNRIRFRTRTRGGGRGFSGSPTYFDESMYLPEISMAAIMPVLSAQEDPQAWFTGSAVDQAWHEDGIVFARVRDRALNGDHKRLAYLEWSLDAETPDQVEASAASDPAVWALTNPALGIRISEDYIEAEQRELPARSFAVDRLGVGDWPPVDGSGDQIIPIEVWDGLADDPSAAGARMLDPVFFAFAMTPDRSRSAIAAVGRREDSSAQLEVVEHRTGSAWLPGRLSELEEKHQPVAILCDGGGPAGSLVHQCEMQGLTIEVLAASDYAKAFGTMLDVVEERGLRHLGGENLRSAVKGATKRPIGDGAYGWGRRNSLVDISPLEAGTLALWGYSNEEKGEVAIF
jgi:hypothetical protein